MYVLDKRLLNLYIYIYIYIRYAFIIAIFTIKYVQFDTYYMYILIQNYEVPTAGIKQCLCLMVTHVFLSVSTY